MKRNDQNETPPEDNNEIPTPPEDVIETAHGKNDPDIKTMQEQLIKKGYHCGVTGANGELNPATVHAVRMIQAFNGLNVTGVLDEETQKVINAE